MRRLNLIGKKFGRLTVTDGPTYKGRRVAWVCTCDCGNVKTIAGNMLTNDNTRSCGCLRRETTAARLTTHGMASSKDQSKRTAEYKVWAGIKRRCQNPAEERYPAYGGRGIKICSRWSDSFEAFLTDMGKRPSARHQIDRIDNDGDYEPGNCRWVDRRANMNNRSDNRFLQLGEERMTVADWERRTGIPSAAIRARIDRYGWTVERALTTPVK